MRIRAKANGNLLDLPDEEAEQLVATGIYEKVDVQDDGKPKAKKGGYQTRVMKPE